MSFVKLSVLINGKVVTTYQHEGKTYVEGRKGSEYTLVVENLTSGYKKVVISVDGLNIVSGNIDWKQGYPLAPYGRLSIPGWLKDSMSFAKFQFSNSKDSYNNKNENGQATSIGVIGCMVFDENSGNLYRSYHDNNINGYSISSFYLNSLAKVSSVTASASINNVGTAHGDKTSFKTTTSNIKFYDTPLTKMALYYDDADGLEARGIVVKREKVFVDPDPFPGYGAFCPDPR